MDIIDSECTNWEPIGGICKPASWGGAPGSNHILSNIMASKGAKLRGLPVRRSWQLRKHIGSYVLLVMSIGATTISHATSFLLCASFISLKLLTTKIGNELCDSHKRKRCFVI